MLNVCHKNEDELRTFKQMLECVLDTAEVRHKYNRHWEPIYMRCNVCDDMNYDNVSEYCSLEAEMWEVGGRTPEGRLPTKGDR